MTAEIYIGLPEKQQQQFKIGHVNHIIKVVCEAVGVAESEMKSQSRKREFVEARQIIIGLLFDKPKTISYTNLGKVLGDRDHSTMIYGNETFKDLYSTDKKFRLKVDSIKKLITLS